MRTAWSRIRWRVSCVIPGLPLSAFETVFLDKPSALAISAMLTFLDMDETEPPFFAAHPQSRCGWKESTEYVYLSIALTGMSCQMQNCGEEMAMQKNVNVCLHSAGKEKMLLAMRRAGCMLDIGHRIPLYPNVNYANAPSWLKLKIYLLAAYWQTTGMMIEFTCREMCVSVQMNHNNRTESRQNDGKEET